MNLKKTHDEVMRLSDPNRLARKMADSFEPGDTPGTFKLPKMTPLVQASEWQPIETAPTYMRVVIATAKRVGEAWQSLNCSDTWDWCWADGEMLDANGETPTHWMPLPTRPQKDEPTKAEQALKVLRKERDDALLKHPELARYRSP